MSTRRPQWLRRLPSPQRDNDLLIRSTAIRLADTIARVRWFVHPSLTPAVAEALVRHRHTVVPLAEAEMESIHLAQLDVITADDELVDLVLSGAKFKRSIVQLAIGPGDVEQDDAVDRLFARYKRLTPGRLYTVSASRVKVRQLPTNAVV